MQTITIESGNNKATFTFEGENVQINFEPAINCKIKNATPDELFVNNIAAILVDALTGGKGDK